MLRGRVFAGVGIFLVLALFGPRLFGQEDEVVSEDSKLNTNLGMAFTVPVNPTAQFISNGWGVIVVGAGYNFNDRHALVGEFMWNSLFPNNTVLRPIRLAENDPSIHGHSNVFSVTMNYRYELRGKTVGAYFIGGGGLYYRTSSIHRSIATGSSVACTREFLFWGFSCSSGIVDEDQTLASSSSAAFGGNGGVGITFKTGEPRYRVYLEARYHFAPNIHISTQYIPVTFGIRF